MIITFHKEIAELVQETELALRKIMEVNLNLFDRDTIKAEAHLDEFAHKLREISKYAKKLQIDIRLATEEKEFSKE